ncbi:hypothetical protein LTR56_005742 [Elasticomyces elasticus]|nr:hypothetical protein LTR56_005742 [Elasticomyces elasticus]KAK3657461.1 hypothetical protein LTR22_009327 [Elasticomyces elasticus]KAK4925672.1 hypothetical protein LTR49_007282 [Elasticomyces elasticus]KAK5765004.1 hypothetical protein LTS12_004782 [Elasticomyces elasticus]
MTDQKEMLCIGDAPGGSEVIFESLSKALGELSIPAPCPSTAGPVISATVELLEQVLQHCPAMDLVKWQSVSPQWHVVINNTKSLQQKLFRTLPNRPMLILDMTTRPMSWYEWRQKPTIMEDRTGAKIVTEGTGTNRPVAVVHLHPWLSHIPQYSLCIYFSVEPKAMLSLRSGLGQHMFVTMPPAATVKLRYSAAIAGKKKAATVERYVCNAAGVTLGDLSRQLECDIQRQKAVEVNGFASRNEKKFAEFVQRLGQRAERISRMAAELKDNPGLFTIRGEAKACVFLKDNGLGGLKTP